MVRNSQLSMLPCSQIVQIQNHFRCPWKSIIIILLEMGKHREQDDASSDESCDENEEQKVQIRKPKIERIDKFKTLKKIIINISMTQYPVVSEVAEDLGWKIQESNEAGDWDVYWTDFAIDPDILIKMHLFQKINHYPGMHVIARKNLLGINLMSLRSKFPEEYNFFPLTWMLPMQYAEFRAYYETKPKGKARTYIAKPEADCQGRGIFLTRKLQDLENGKHYVVQRYLARPFLLEGLKFDLRIYVLLCGTNPLRLYMYNQGLARLATEAYIEPTTSNLQKQYMHLTNYAINKNNPKFVFNNNSNNMGIGHKRSISCVFKQLAALGVNIDQLKEKINDVTIKTLICGLPHMSHQYRCSQPQDYLGNMCFHILGLDIMLNSKGEPVVLEVNHTPSFTTDTPLDHKIKFNLIKDSLKIMNVNVQSKNELFSKAKDLNKERLLSGKRQIFEGKEREAAINEAQSLRDEFEDKNLGGFSRIFPLKDEQKMKKYNEIIETANKTYFEQSGSIRMKQLQKQAKKLIKSDYKQMKKSRLEQSEKVKQTVSEFRSQHLNPEQKVPRPTLSEVKQSLNDSEKKSTMFEEIEQSMDQSETLTKSENNIQRQNERESRSQFVPNLIKKFSEKHEKAIENSSSIIKIKKLPQPQPQPQSRELTHPQSNECKPFNEPKSASIRKVNTREQFTVDRTQNIQLVSRQKERMKSITVGKSNYKRPNVRQNQRQFPNLADSEIINHGGTAVININNGSDLFRNDEKQLAMNRPQRINRSGKIYECHPRDIQNALDKKTGAGNFVMPKLINLNFQNDRKATDPPSALPPFRKNNVIYQNQ